MNLTFGNVYEFEFEDNPAWMAPGEPVHIAGTSLEDALQRWNEARRSGYAPYYPPILSIKRCFTGVAY